MAVLPETILYMQWLTLQQLTHEYKQPPALAYWSCSVAHTHIRPLLAGKISVGLCTCTLAVCFGNL